MLQIKKKFTIYRSQDEGRTGTMAGRVEGCTADEGLREASQEQTVPRSVYVMYQKSIAWPCKVPGSLKDHRHTGTATTI